MRELKTPPRTKLNGYPLALLQAEEQNVKQYLKIFALSAALMVPAAMSAQDRDHQNRDRQDQGQSEKQRSKYEDRAHNDSHEWNSNEDQKYRQYLQEHHKKYRDFDRLKQRDRDKYWNWRHEHSDNDGR